MTTPEPRAKSASLKRAQMAELVDALVSGTSAARRGGSSPLLGTKYTKEKPCLPSGSAAFFFSGRTAQDDTVFSCAAVSDFPNMPI